MYQKPKAQRIKVIYRQSPIFFILCKNTFCLILQVWQFLLILDTLSPFGSQTSLILTIWVFGWKITRKCLESTKKVENGQSSTSTRFQLCAAPKSWLKYTTNLSGTSPGEPNTRPPSYITPHQPTLYYVIVWNKSFFILEFAVLTFLKSLQVLRYLWGFQFLPNKIYRN